MLFNYDDRNKNSIYRYAKKLEGMTFNDILDEYNKSAQKYYVNPYIENYFVSERTPKYDIPAKIPSGKAKGQLGNLLERFYFGYFPNGVQDADFSKTGIELKQTPIDLKKNGEYTNVIKLRH